MNFDANCGPLLLRIFLGIPWSFQILSLKILAIPSDKIFIVVAFSHIIFVNQSMMTTMAFILLNLGKGLIISILISLSQIRYSLVVILGLNSVSGVQYKDMMIDR